MNNWLDRISPCIRVVGNEAASGGWLEAMRVIYEHELVLFRGSDFETGIIDSGVITTIPCPAESFIIVPPGTRHISRECSGRGGHRHWIHFDWIFAGDNSQTPLITYCPAKPQEEYLRPAPDWIPDGILHGPVRDMMKVDDLLMRIDNRWNRGTPRERLMARSLLLELLLELLSDDQDDIQPAQEDTAYRIASRARRELNRFARIPLRDAPSVQELLSQSGITYAHQCRIFKSHYGITPMQYVNELRMSEIKNLLRDTDVPVSAIAEMTGYDNLGYFSRSFRKHTGMTPREYRNS